MLKHKAFKFRLYPTNEQAVLIHKTIGCSRFVYNHYLNQWKEACKQTGKGFSYTQCNKDLTSLKKQAETNWLKEVDSTSLQASLRNLADSFARFFAKQTKFPRFKSKKNSVQSYKTYFTNNNIEVIGNKIKLPKLGWVKFAKSREVKGRILSATIRRKPSGKYFVSVLCEVAI